jgi:ubiquinone/menaquinone biosynthesis C-methylase UbiE
MLPEWRRPDQKGTPQMDPTVAGDSPLQSDVLEDLESAVRYRHWLCSLAHPYLGDDPIEIGAGLGYHASEWADAGVRLSATEADAGRLQALQDRFVDDDRVTVQYLPVPIDVSANHTSLVAYNVLEHIEDDVAALKAFARLLRPGGAVVLVVPAFPSAMSNFDRAIGHYRRYRRTTLRNALTSAGLTVEQLHYLNAPGLLVWYLVVKLLRQRPKQGLGLKAYDRFLVPLTSLVERRIAPPFGQSVFAVARRPDAEPPGPIGPSVCALRGHA